MAGLRDLAHKLISGAESAHQPRSAEEPTNREGNAMAHTTLDVEGMSCGHCKAAVEGELAKLDGVEHSEADFDNNTVGVRYEEARVSTDDLRSAVEAAGYRVVN